MADGLARQIAGLAGDIRNLGKRIPSYQRGVVANVSPPTVVMDRDVTATPRPVADVLVPGLAVGQRVEVRVIGSRRVITSIHPGDSEPDDTGWYDPGAPDGYKGTSANRVRVKGGFCTVAVRLVAASSRSAGTLAGAVPGSPDRTMTADTPLWFEVNHGGATGAWYTARVFGDGSVNVYNLPAHASGTTINGTVTYPVG